jgi:hypothetical protein
MKGWWPVKTEHLTPSDVARQARQLVAAEKESRRYWQELAEEDKERVVWLIRAELLRLLETPAVWVPGSLRPRDGDRLDVTISLDLSVERAWNARRQAEQAGEIAMFTEELLDHRRRRREDD